MRHVLILAATAYISSVMIVKRYLWLILLLPLVVCLLLFPQTAASSCLEALRICGTALIPSLFPYMVLCKLIVGLQLLPKGGKRIHHAMRRLFGIGGGSFPALLVSFVGGYPVGVAAVCELYQKGVISKQEAERALLFCNNSGPAFFLGVIGTTVLNDVRAGLILYFIHIVSALLTGHLFTRPYFNIRQLDPPSDAAESFGTVFLASVGDACSSILKICSLVITFRIVLSLCAVSGVFHLLPFGAEAIVSGTLELSCGIVRLIDHPNAFVLASLFMGWGGLCVHMQAGSLSQPLGLKPKGYYIAKLLHGALAMLLAYIWQHPTALWIMIGCGCVGLCILIPQIRKKWAGNPKHIAV